MSAGESLDVLRSATADLDAGALLDWAGRRFAGRIALASSLSAEDQVLTDLIAAQPVKPISVFTIDTGRLPQETHDVLDATRARYGLAVRVLTPDRADLEAMLASAGTNLFYASVANRRRCCQVRKVGPLRRALAGLGAWITGQRREQSSTRSRLERIEWDDANGLVKLNPLADWTSQQVWDYVRQRRVPYNALHDRGYPSIGCAPCTRAVPPGQDVRAGRWWWEHAEHKECGLHGPSVGSGRPRIEENAS